MAKTIHDHLDSIFHEGDQAIWSIAALVLALQAVASEDHRAASQAVLDASGMGGVADLEAEDAGGLVSQAAAPIHQVAASLRGEGQTWTAQSDEALRAQGRASAQESYAGR